MEKELITLPEIRNIKKLPCFFPCEWQAVIFRNYGMVETKKLAEILKTDQITVIEEVKALGISEIKYNPEWLSRGYITIIKNNWHLLSYRQIAYLLGIDEKRLAFILKEDDFLSVKLGEFKPQTEEPFYYLLNEEQKKETEKIRKIVKENKIKLKRQPFDFFEKNSNIFYINQNSITKDRIIYSYFALYGDCLSDEEGTEKSYPDYLLEKYSKLGINGIWLQGLLYQFSHYPFKPELSEGYENRRKNLKKLVERCKNYGIKVFLYFNEPRGMDDNFFENNSDIKGDAYDNLFALCTSKEKVKQYLYNSVKDLLENVPELGGIITITMSENPTHCYSRSKNCECICPDCSKKGVEEIAAEINNIIHKGIKDSKSKAKLIANLWGWDEFMGWNTDRAKLGIDLLNKDIDIMLVSENSMKIDKGGIKSTVIDYSISNIGPSDRSKILMSYAKTKGHKVLAKVQINNSWECSTVPYIPVVNLIEKHLSNLNEIGIDGLMLSWTLGGFPGGNLEPASYLYGKNGNIEKWYEDTFEKDFAEVKKAIKMFSDGFEEFPFDLNFLYNGPQNLGAANLWYLEKTGLKATMVCFPYDDIESWKGAFDIDTLINQLKKLNENWKKGLDFLYSLKKCNKKTEELKIIASACYANFNSSYLQCEFNVKKQQSYDRKELMFLIEEELNNVKILQNAVSENACIGYEASNHYYFNQNSLLEKIINLNCLKERI